jgi:rfaE bifunctional protein nucleotidyltransferase chain/domain
MSTLNILKSKIIFEKEQLTNYLEFLRNKKQPIVFTNGCFDIVHRGHIEYLAQAADLGAALIIGLNSDSSVRRLKGETRPIIDEYSRALLLSALSFVNKVVLFQEDTPYELIKFIQPDVLVKGSDYKPQDIVGYDIVMAKAGKIATIDFIDGFSTTSILQKACVPEGKLNSI